MLVNDPNDQRNRQYTASQLGALAGTHSLVEFSLLESRGGIKGYIVLFGSPAAILSLMSTEARRAAPDISQPVEDGVDRQVVGLWVQRRSRADGPQRFVRGVVDLSSGQGIWEICDSPVIQSSGGTALPVTDGSAAGVAVPYP